MMYPRVRGQREAELFALDITISRGASVAGPVAFSGTHQKGSAQSCRVVADSTHPPKKTLLSYLRWERAVMQRADSSRVRHPARAWERETERGGEGRGKGIRIYMAQS